MRKLTEKLCAANPLSREDVAEAVRALASEELGAPEKADFLAAFARKGETSDEIASFARELREKSNPVHLDQSIRNQGILDVCGTGGDHLNTFNISTAVAILVAGAGVYVAKHGNRAITSRSGSADVLEALGIPVTLPPAAAASTLAEKGFAFFFAPHYHPAFKHINPARKICAERGQRTIFNLLGPLLNPARPDAQLVGVPRPEWCESIARVLQSLGVRRAMVVSGHVGTRFLDELSPLGDNTVAEFYQERGFNTSILAGSAFGFSVATIEDLQGGDSQANARIIEALFRGEEKGPRRDAVLFNAAAALVVAGRSKSLMEGLDQAAAVIDTGGAAAKLESLRRS